MSSRSIGVLTATALVLAGCGARDPGPGLPSLGSGEATSTVAVSRQDVASVVTLEATVVASPNFAVLSDHPGQLRFTGHNTGIVAEVSSESGQFPVSLPPHSVLVGGLVPDEVSVTAGLPVVVAQYVGLAMNAPIPPSSLHRFSGVIGDVRAQVDEGPGPFDCPVLGSPGPVVGSSPGDEGSTGATEGVSNLGIVCMVPRDLRILVGSPGVVAVTTGTASNVLVLPVEAVAGLSGMGRVTILDAQGRTQEREVSLGITDGSVVEIVSGVSEGDQVVVPAPNLRSG